MTAIMGLWVRPALAAAMLAASALSAAAQEQEQPVSKLTGTLAKVNGSGTIAIGYRVASFPFSYLGPGNQPMGYSIDLCHAIVEEIGREIDKPDLKVAYIAVTPETRMQAVVSGKADLECGSTTSNAERQKQVAFSPIMFVTGTKLMVKRHSPIRSYRDLKGKVVVVTAGTTNEQALKRLNEKFELGANIISARDHEESYSLVVDGKADAFATDDILLYGLIAHHNAQRELIVVGDFLSYDPYGIMFRKDDPQLNQLVVRTFEQLAESRDLVLNYDKWFVRKTPTGERINLPMGPQLEEIFHVLGVVD
jgi:glutamate/aspartate transport system substrate-binding protein